jgi:hypothetical protein
MMMKTIFLDHTLAFGIKSCFREVLLLYLPFTPDNQATSNEITLDAGREFRWNLGSFGCLNACLRLGHSGAAISARAHFRCMKQSLETSRTLETSRRLSRIERAML